MNDAGGYLLWTLSFNGLCALIKQMNDATNHEQRSRQVADSTRRFLIGVNTGGIGLVTLLAGKLVDNAVAPGWMVGPIFTFTLGLVFVGVSLFLAKHRAIKRSIAAEKDQQQPDYKRWYWRSMTWDILSALFFVMAVLCTLAQISRITI